MIAHRISAERRATSRMCQDHRRTFGAAEPMLRPGDDFVQDWKKARPFSVRTYSGGAAPIPHREGGSGSCRQYADGAKRSAGAQSESSGCAKLGLEVGETCGPQKQATRSAAAQRFRTRSSFPGTARGMVDRRRVEAAGELRCHSPRTEPHRDVAFRDDVAASATLQHWRDILPAARDESPEAGRVLCHPSRVPMPTSRASPTPTTCCVASAGTPFGPWLLGAGGEPAGHWQTSVRSRCVSTAFDIASRDRNPGVASGPHQCVANDEQTPLVPKAQVWPMALVPPGEKGGVSASTSCGAVSTSIAPCPAGMRNRCPHSAVIPGRMGYQPGWGMRRQQSEQRWVVAVCGGETIPGVVAGFRC